MQLGNHLYALHQSVLRRLKLIRLAIVIQQTHAQLYRQLVCQVGHKAAFRRYGLLRIRNRYFLLLFGFLFLRKFGLLLRKLGLGFLRKLDFRLLNFQFAAIEQRIQFVRGHAHRKGHAIILFSRHR